jgi:hypothetical protein
MATAIPALEPHALLALAALLWAHFADDVGAVPPDEALVLLLDSGRLETPSL